jgi:DNA-binding NtrC family response regulator
MVADGTFREDLYYRLNVIPVHIPPLRERRDDIPLLVQHFLQKLAAESGRPPIAVSQDGMRRLMSYQWPGNVRQLENVVERAIAFSGARTQIELHDFGPEIQQPAAISETGAVLFPEDGLDFDQYIEAIELSLIKRSLERTRGNKRQAAKLLKLKRTTLIEKLKRLDSAALPMRHAGAGSSDKLP